MLQRSIRLAAAVLVVAAVARLPGSGRAPRTNVLLVTVDTLRADRLGCYGFPFARTPAIDGLARDGVRCADAVTVAPLTLPSHASIMTGLYPPAHGVRDNGNYALGDEVVTLAERLRAAGYRTAAFVSAQVLQRQYNLAQGFDVYDDDLWTEDAPPLFMIRERRAPKTARRALGWLARHAAAGAARPFFVWVHFFDPHQPYDPDPADAALSPTLYDAEIAGVDRALARLLDALRARGVLDDTLVIFAADHGEALGEHGEATHGLFIYDSTVRIPLVWRLPRLLPGGRVCEDPVSTVDVVPTVLGVLGLPGGEETQGLDLLPALQGRARLPARPRYVESMLAEAGFGMAPLRGVRLEGYTWIRAPRPELYDLRTDPGEQHNLYPGDAERSRRLDAALAAVLADSRRRAVPVRTHAMDRETEEMLRALGYLAPAEQGTAMGGIDPKDGVSVWRAVEDARHRCARGDWAGAEALLRGVLRTTAANVTARNLLALAVLRQGRPEEAEREYLASLALDGRQARVYAALGGLALERGRLEEAARHYREALDVTPGFVDAMSALGLIEALRGDDTAARAWYQRAIATDPSFPHVYRRLADLYYRRGDWARALANYRRMLAVLPHHFEALVQAGNCERYLGAPRAAAGYYAEAQQARPDSWVPPYNLACLRAAEGDAEAALALLHEAAAKGLHDPRLLAENDDLGPVRRLAAYAGLLAEVGAQRPVVSPPTSAARH